MSNASPVVREEPKQDGAPPRRDEPATPPRLPESIALLKRYAAAVADSRPEPGSDAAVGIERPLAEVRRMAQETAAAAESPPARPKVSLPVDRFHVCSTVGRPCNNAPLIHVP